MVRRERAVSRLRTTKHAAWVARKRSWAAVEPALAPVIDAGFRAYTRARPPSSVDEETAKAIEAAPRRIFCLWTGDNPMSANRRRALESIRMLNAPDVEVVLITPHNVAEWVVPGHPLHPAYADLALIHRADYLRTYLMHHHGGGYTDVKDARTSWAPFVESLNAGPNAWLLGYPELSYRFLAPSSPPLRRQLQIHHSRLLGNGAYIVKPRTPFTAKWLHEAERRLDLWRSDLHDVPGDVYSGPEGYPVPFYGLLGEIFHPLCLRYHTRLLQDERITPQLRDYK